MEGEIRDAFITATIEWERLRILTQQEPDAIPADERAHYKEQYE